MIEALFHLIPARIALLSVSLLTAGAASAQASTTTSPIVIDVNAPVARSINSYNLFKDVAKQIPNEGLIPFEINVALFADYAEKYRFLYLPPGEHAIYDGDKAFRFPVGTVFVKTFAYPVDQRDPGKGARIIETRLLMHRPDGWVGYPYVWNEDLSDARLAVAGARIPVSWIHGDGEKRDLLYTVPNMNLCKLCHKNNDIVGPIGPKARQLNRDIPFGASTVNQLTQWIDSGILVGAPTYPKDIPRMPAWDDEAISIDVRGRSYLDGNCAHCHSLGGDAGYRGLDFTWSNPADAERSDYHEEAPPGTVGRPTRPVFSFCLPRLRATEPWLVMPRVGRTIPHEEGIALLEAWETGIQRGELEAPTYLRSVK